MINYFELEVDLEKLLSKWEQDNSEFRDISKHLKGFRILKQDPLECFFSFIISQNNTVNNIRNIVQKIKKLNGNYVASISGFSLQKKLAIEIFLQRIYFIIYKNLNNF